MNNFHSGPLSLPAGIKCIVASFPTPQPFLIGLRRKCRKRPGTLYTPSTKKNERKRDTTDKNRNRVQQKTSKINPPGIDFYMQF